MDRDIALRVKDALAGVAERKGIPALVEVSFDEEQCDAFFSFALPDYRGGSSESPKYSGYVQVGSHEGGRVLSTVIPSVYSTKDTSPNADVAAFADAMQSTAAIGNGKVFLANGSIGIASDVLLGPSFSEAELQVAVHLGVRSALATLFEFLLRAWSRKAQEALDEPTWKQRVDANFALLERSLGPSPLGERLGNVI